MIITPVILTDVSTSQEMWCLRTTIQFGKEQRRLSLISVHRLAFSKKKIDGRNWLRLFSLLAKEPPKFLSVKFYRCFPFLTNIFLLSMSFYVLSVPLFFPLSKYSWSVSQVVAAAIYEIYILFRGVMCSTQLHV